jgi:S-DNA-T family DNA segregation ATPase FtsK/SpoIIIE
MARRPHTEDVQYVPVSLPYQDPPKRRAWPIRAWRWMSRNRMWIWPTVAPVSLLTTAQMAYANGWGLWVLCGCLVVSSAICMSAPDRWDRAQEVRYVRATAVGVGAWLTASALLGLGVRVLGQPVMMWSLAAGWVVWCFLGWRHKRVRRPDRLLAEWQEEWRLAANRVRLAGSEVIDYDGDDQVDSLLIALDRGRQSISHVRTAVDDILAAMEYPPEVTARVEQHPRNRSWVWLHFQHEDPLAEVQEWDEDLAPSSFLDPFTVGFTPNGGRITTSMSKAHWFVVGQTQWGKSSWISLLMAQLSACDDVLIWFIDLKGGGTAAPWMPCIDWLATSHDEAELMLTAAKRVINARSAITDDHIPSPDDPAIVIVIDEANEAFGQGTGRASLVAAGVSVASLGAGLSVDMVVATQIGALYAVGDERIRSNLSKNLAFRCQQDSHAEYALGDWGSLKASRLDEKGKFYFKDQQSPSVLGRGYWLTRTQRARIARQNAGRRPTLPEALALHAGEAYRTRHERSGSTPLPSPKPLEAAVTTPEEIAAEIEAGLPADVPTPAEMRQVDQARVAEGLPSLSAEDAASTGQDRFVAALTTGPHSPKDLERVSGMSKSWVAAYLAKLVEYGAVSQSAPRQPYQAVPGMDVGQAMEAIREERRRIEAKARELVDA